MAGNLNGQSNGLYTYDSFDSNKKNGSNFLWWCAGAQQDLLRNYPSEYVKYSGLGGVLLATFALAAISAGYALYSIFHNAIAAVFFGLLWGLIIFNFDRFLVSTMRKYGLSTGKQIQMAIPRIVLAVLIGFTIARPLELKIFEKEINVKVAENMHAKIFKNDSLLREEERAFINEAQTEKNRLQGRRSALEDTLHGLRSAYVSEADGTGGSGRRGIEQLTRLKMDAYNRALQSSTPEIGQLTASIQVQDSILGSIKGSVDSKRKAYEASLAANVGFLERNKALSDLSDEESSVFWTSLLITLLIILIETGPIISKLIMQAGPYDIALAKDELVGMADAESEIRRNKAMVFERNKKYYNNKLDISEEILSQLTQTQRRKIREAFDKWEKGENSGPKRPPLKNLLIDLKEELQFDEDHLL